MSRWQALSKNGERALACGQTGLAKFAWQEAAQLAQQMAEQMAEQLAKQIAENIPNPAPQIDEFIAFHTSQHQLACLALAQQQPNVAAMHYCQAYAKLRRLCAALLSVAIRSEQVLQLQPYLQQSADALRTLSAKGISNPQMDTLLLSAQ
jgi:basic membrane lipoprotein Med (substrate-binding protein (PBP1-ABC) superfamily)